MCATDEVLEAAKLKVDDAIYQVEAAMATGNQTATPEYTLAQGERVLGQTQYVRGAHGWRTDK